MRRKWKPIAVVAIAVVLVLAIAGAVLAGGLAWRGSSPSTTASTLAASSVTTSVSTAAISLSDEEKAALLFLREEEKLARDVYSALSAKWNARVFGNISTSESRHMASVKTLLDRYGLADPVGVNAPGVFADPALQALYTQLVAQGSQSLQDAYEVGVTIETLDIEDLQALLAMPALPSDVATVARNLLAGSQNHLASFSRLAK
jgi:hypothetical protein